VLNIPAAVAVLAALSQLGVETFEGLGVEPVDLHGADGRPDVLVDLADVSLTGRGLQLDDLQVPVQQLVDRGAGAGAAALVDLGLHPRPGALGLGAGTERLLEVVLLAGERVDPAVYAGTERAARQLLDPSALPALRGGPPPGHGAP
jgi:hypothetical protein